MESASNAALFASGLFFGGAIDHAILAALRRDVTPYGVRVGVSANWLLALADLTIAGVLYQIHASRSHATRTASATLRG